MNNFDQQFFTQQLIHWHLNENTRSLPWKSETDPYKIWLSEIMLQQTRVEQGLQYYLNFTEAFPTICDLANAADETVFKMWQGLGYYNRCKNMLATARFICNDLEGVFPSDFESILALKGVGAYTAAAIASFAFSQPCAVVDGNVYRVLSRYFGIETAIDSSLGKKQFQQLAQLLLPPNQSAQYNQSIMDFGATVCTPQKPKCAECLINNKCKAFQQSIQHLLPVKEKKIKVQTRYFNFFVFKIKDQVWIQKREDSGIWQNLYQFYLVESDNTLDDERLLSIGDLRGYKKSIKNHQKIASIKQRLTHQLIISDFFEIELKNKIDLPSNGFWEYFKKIDQYAFPKTIVDFLNNYVFD